MKFAENDIPLISAFLSREVSDFRFVEREVSDFRFVEGVTNEEVTQRYLTQLVEELEKIDKKADFICIQSLSNLGLLERELKITPANGYWDYKSLIICILPPAPLPRGHINVKWIEK